ncbi:glyoxalase [Bacillus sp. sid0103]|uniref:glyoxalase n=1 Tax=Bacillus sp. sid0103 TaxID=2856337 RepID=UPI001C46842B|nr:glyoxalase [Bacillus sp. sid0103]MBV7506228.1 glyoxalase [Bacillus sp. sid0103]
MVPQRVSLLTIGAYDLPVLRKFYQTLGWEETEISTDQYAVFKTAGVLLSLYPIAELANDAGIEFRHSPESFHGVTFSINVDQQEQVDTTIEIIRSAGAKILPRLFPPQYKTNQTFD